VLGGDTRIVSDLKGASRLLNTLEGKVCAGESTVKVFEHSGDLLKEKTP
jgi:hypothetical protein